MVLKSAKQKAKLPELELKRTRWAKEGKEETLTSIVQREHDEQGRMKMERHRTLEDERAYFAGEKAPEGVREIDFIHSGLMRYVWSEDGQSCEIRQGWKKLQIPDWAEGLSERFSPLVKLIEIYDEHGKFVKSDIYHNLDGKGWKFQFSNHSEWMRKDVKRERFEKTIKVVTKPFILTKADAQQENLAYDFFAFDFDRIGPYTMLDQVDFHQFEGKVYSVQRIARLPNGATRIVIFTNGIPGERYDENGRIEDFPVDLNHFQSREGCFFDPTLYTETKRVRNKEGYTVTSIKGLLQDVIYTRELLKFTQINIVPTTEEAKKNILDWADKFVRPVNK